MFIHLRLHSEYSIRDGLLKVGPMCDFLAKEQTPAVALTDISNLYGMVKFYRGAQSRGVKPIIGAEVWLEDEGSNIGHGTNKNYTKLVLLVKNEEGYKNLIEILTNSFLHGQQLGTALTTFEFLAEHSNGLIVLSGAMQSEIARLIVNGKYNQAKQQLYRWKEVFADNFYLELQRIGLSFEDSYIEGALRLAKESDTAIVATNNVCFLHKDDYEAHEARVCINRGMTLKEMGQSSGYTRSQYLKSQSEMKELFSDIPQAIQNTAEIAKRCSLDVTLGEVFLPDFPVPPGCTIEKYLEQEAREGLDKRLAKTGVFQGLDRNDYDERLSIELDVINKMGFAGYFLIVSDFIRWAKTHDILVGPGRGSGAGSLVAYVLEITDLDPLEHELLFERFLNPERISMPDFDIDFCMENRDRVIEYVAKRYGRKSVSQIITFGTMAAKAVVRDAGRVLGHPYFFVDKIAKLIPFEIGITLDKALEQEEALLVRYETEEEVKLLINLAKKLEGLVRNVGKHAGGVVIAPSKLTDFCPLYVEENSHSIVTQFDKDDVESIGLVKFDFLGLRTLTIIDWAIQNINEQLRSSGKQEISIDGIKTDDVKTYDLLKRCNTTAVFQLESRGMKELIARLQPDKLEDIIALVALFRPGPLQSGMVDDFIARKHGREKIEYPHPDLEDILKPTYGVILYQEQVMQIAQVLAGYTLGGADLLRRAMGKKKPEEMAKQRAIFTKGAMAREVEEKTATYIFDLIEKFAGYGFNKSHSAAYGLISYQTAWLKAHYTAAFMAAVLSSDMNQTEKVVTLIDECSNLGIKVLPPDVNQGHYKFTVKNDNEIVYGLGAIKGLGEAAILNLIEVREKLGSYKNISNFCKNVDLKKVNKRSIEALIKSGAMDCFGVQRKALFDILFDKAMAEAEQKLKNDKIGQGDLFDDYLSDENEDLILAKLPKDYAWSEQERLTGEKDSLGLYLTGHPINQYKEELKNYTTCTLANINTGQKKVRVAGMIVDIKTKITKKGDKMAFLTLDDASARMEVAVFPSTYANSRDFLIKDALIILHGEVSTDPYTQSPKIKTEKIMSLACAREKFSYNLELTLREDVTDKSGLSKIKDIIATAQPGNSKISIKYMKKDAQARFLIQEQVSLDDTLVNELKKLLGDAFVEVIV